VTFAIAGDPSTRRLDCLGCDAGLSVAPQRDNLLVPGLPLKMLCGVLVFRDLNVEVAGYQLERFFEWQAVNPAHRRESIAALFVEAFIAEAGPCIRVDVAKPVIPVAQRAWMLAAIQNIWADITKGR
jgi:hypothetical protein